MSSPTTCGFVAIVGRPNVGKSTLLNKLLGRKLCITSRKPQTTRHRILGVKTTGNSQIIYVDTPGMHQQAKKAMNRYMNKAAFSSLQGVDVVVFVVEGMAWRDDDEWALQKVSKIGIPIILLINKVDTIKDKGKLLPFINELNAKHSFSRIIPVSAKTGKNLDLFEQIAAEFIPEGDFLYDPDQFTDRNLRFLVAEIIREKLIRLLGKEIPYALTVEVERYKEKPKIIDIDALILIDKASQKSIVIGKSGEKLKQVGSLARKDIEKLVEKKVFLRLWVKVKSGWADDEKALRSLGYS